MREYIRLVESVLNEGAGTFRLHPALNPENYVMTASLADHEKWQAMTYDGSSAGEKDARKGQMGGIGYVMISLKDDTIIPISRSDEHHRGADTLYTLSRKTKGAIDPSDYLPIWSYGNNYIYNKSEAPILLTALTKFIAYGGKNGVLKGSSGLRGIAMSSKQFIASGGNVEVSAGKLAPLGAEIYEGFENLAQALRKARSNPEARSVAGAAFEAAIGLLRLLMRDRLEEKGIDVKEIETLMPKLRQIKQERNVQALEELFFGFHGVKNTIHNNLRAAQKRAQAGEEVWRDGDLKAIWGDIDLAVDMLGRF